MYLFFSGFRGSFRPPALPNHGLEDNRPDVHHEAGFDIPNTQAVLERFMSNMSKLADVEYQALSDLLDSLPDHSSYTTAKTMTAAAARENGVIPEADADSEASSSMESPSNQFTVSHISYVYTEHINSIYILHTIYMLCIYKVYTTYILHIFIVYT